MSSSTSSTKRRYVESEEKENQNDDTNDGMKKMKMTDDDDRLKIRNQIIEEFQKRNLEIPFQLIDAIDRSETSKANRSHGEHRKELYTRLSQYLDRRHVRIRGQTYIFPDLIHQMIRCRFPNDIRAYDKVKTFKNGKLTDVLEDDKYYVQWEDFCKKIH